MPIRLSELSCQLWLVLFIVLFNSFKYFSMATVLTLFATNEYGISDVQAGSLYGMWGLLHTVWGFVGSLAVDHFGIRKVALTATSLGIISRGLLVFTHSKSMLYLMLCGLGPIAEGVCDPLYMVAIKKLTRRRVRAFAFGLQYAFMNLGGAFGESFIAFARQRQWMMPWGEEYSGLRATLFVTWLSAIVCWLLAWKLCDPGNKETVPHWSPGLEGNAFNQPASTGYVAFHSPSPEPSPPASPKTPKEFTMPAEPNETIDLILNTEEVPAGFVAPVPGLVEEFHRSSQALQFVKSYVLDPAFHRAVFQTAAVMFVSLQWKYMDTLMPKFSERVFGPSVPWGAIYSINNWMCVLCPPIVSALAPGDRVDDFCLIVPGLWIMALSPLCIWASISPVSTTMWVFLLSCGEVLWSPRNQSFIASLAPKGREGAFLALAHLPTFFSQYPVGLISGWLLNTYCPACPKYDNESCTRDASWNADPAAMWLFVAMSSAVSPVLVTCCLKYLRQGGTVHWHDDDD